MKIPFLGGMGGLELVIILVVVLLIFGPKNLPKLGSAIGRTVKNLREGMDEKKDGQGQKESSDAAGAEEVYDYDAEAKKAQDASEAASDTTKHE